MRGHTRRRILHISVVLGGPDQTGPLPTFRPGMALPCPLNERTPVNPDPPSKEAEEEGGRTGECEQE